MTLQLSLLTIDVFILGGCLLIRGYSQLPYAAKVWIQRIIPISMGTLVIIAIFPVAMSLVANI